MSAMYPELYPCANRRPSDDETLLATIRGPLGGAQWAGRSGRLYDHTIYSLVGCPAPGSASYLLVRRDLADQPIVLASGCTRSAHPSLNLAEIRRRGATLGANEVHLFEDRDGDIDAVLADLTGMAALAGSTGTDARAA